MASKGRVNRVMRRMQESNVRMCLFATEVAGIPNATMLAVCRAERSFLAVEISMGVDYEHHLLVLIAVGKRVKKWSRLVVQQRLQDAYVNIVFEILLLEFEETIEHLRRRRVGSAAGRGLGKLGDQISIEDHHGCKVVAQGLHRCIVSVDGEHPPLRVACRGQIVRRRFIVPLSVMW